MLGCSVGIGDWYRRIGFIGWGSGEIACDIVLGCVVEVWDGHSGIRFPCFGWEGLIDWDSEAPHKLVWDEPLRFWAYSLCKWRGSFGLWLSTGLFGGYQEQKLRCSVSFFFGAKGEELYSATQYT